MGTTVKLQLHLALISFGVICHRNGCWQTSLLVSTVVLDRWMSHLDCFWDVPKFSGTTDLCWFWGSWVTQGVMNWADGRVGCYEQLDGPSLCTGACVNFIGVLQLHAAYVEYYWKQSAVDLAASSSDIQLPHLVSSWQKQDPKQAMTWPVEHIPVYKELTWMKSSI